MASTLMNTILASLLVSLMLHSMNVVSSHRICGYKLAKIIRQVCDVAECDWEDDLIKMEIDDEEGLSEKCCAHPSGCTLEYIQRWCCRNENRYEMHVVDESNENKHARSHKKLSSLQQKRLRFQQQQQQRNNEHQQHNRVVDGQFMNLFI